MGQKASKEKKEDGLRKFFEIHEIEFLRKKFADAAIDSNGYHFLYIHK